MCMKGSYILIVKLEENISIKVGQLGVINFKKGFYTYVGSAMNSLERRVERHKRENKNFHWHIDYLLDKSDFIKSLLFASDEKQECMLADKVKELSDSCIKDFGCSDCICKSHLFFFKEFPKSLNTIKI